MPFADMTGSVAGFSEAFRQGLIKQSITPRCRRPPGGMVPQGSGAGATILAAEQNRSRWYADGIIAQGLFETAASCRKPIDVWGTDTGVTSAAQLKGAHLITEDDEDIGASGHGPMLASRSPFVIPRSCAQTPMIVLGVCKG